MSPHFGAGAVIFAIGDEDAPAWLVLKGSIEITRRDGPGYEIAVLNNEAGQFTGEIAQLSGAPSLSAGRAGPDGCVAIPFDAAHLRALMIGSDDVGELIMRALILRRVGLIAASGSESPQALGGIDIQGSQIMAAAR